MLSFQIREEIQRLIRAFDEASYFFDCLEKISSVFPPLNTYIQEIAAGGEKGKQANDQLRSYLAQTRKKTSDVRPRKFFAATEKLQAELKKAQKLGFHDPSQLHEIERKIDAFSRTYEAYIEAYTPQSAGSMVVEARSLLSMLDGFKQGLSFYLSNIESDVNEAEEGRELSIVLQSTMTLPEFTEKLAAIEDLYVELCMLTSVSLTDHPIQIVKIESGSLWAKLFGNTKVMALLASLIESGAGFVYRNYTTEGKLLSIPKKLMLSTRFSN